MRLPPLGGVYPAKIGMSTIYASLLGGLVAMAALALAAWILRVQPSLRLAALLRRNPHRIVWHYVTHRHYKGEHVATTVTVVLDDSRRLDVPVSLEEEEGTVAMIRRCAPDATFGYSDELARVLGSP